MLSKSTRKRKHTKSLLDITVDGKLESGKGADHEETGADAGVGALETELLGDLDEAGGGALAGGAGGLVDLAQHGVGGLRDDGSGETGNETGAEVDNSLHAVGHVLLGEDLVDSLGDLLVDNELGHGVGDPRELSISGVLFRRGQKKNILLEQNGTETGVEGTNTLVLEHLAEAADEAGGIGGLGDETDTGGLKRTEGNIGEELGHGGRGEVDTGAVLGGVLVAEIVDGLLLEQLVTTELEGALEEVTGEGRADTSEEGTSTLILDDLLEATDHAPVVGSGVELDASLNTVEEAVSFSIFRGDLVGATVLGGPTHRRG